MSRQDGGEMIAQDRTGSGQAKPLLARPAKARGHLVELTKERLNKTKEFVPRRR
jgi:hypothetical protein